MRELPQAKRQRFIEQYEFNPEEARILTEDRDLSYYVEKVISELKAWLLSLEETEGAEEEIWRKNKKKLVKMVANWLINKLGGLMKKENISIKELKITPENFAEFITLIYQNKISSSLGQKLLEKMFKTGADPSHIIAEEDLRQVSDEGELGIIIEEAIKNNPQAVKDYQKGKINALQFLVGQIMKQSKGKADPEKVSEILKEKLRNI
jgi:aspartyl-tRNA(Asn)/glutamyl-tRNA(Gln) amidotransferase subunit B